MKRGAFFMKTIKPNFIIIGAMKAATTSLYSYLQQHHEIFMSPMKEPMFFNNLDEEKTYKVKGSKGKHIRSFEEYYSLFNAAKKEKAIGEASPAYIYDKKCPQLIKNNIPEIKIIAILRQPVERAYSNYLHTIRSGKEPIKDFLKAFQEEEKRIAENWSPLYHYKSKGYYFEQLERYYNIFPANNIHIVLFEDLINYPHKTVKEIFKFLAVDESFIPKKEEKKNVSGIPKGIIGWLIMKARYYNIINSFPISKYIPKFLIKIIQSVIYKKSKKLNTKTIHDLTDLYYKKDIKKLEKLIQKDLRSWLR